MNGYANPRTQVTTEWLSRHLHSPQVRVVEVIWGSLPDYGLEAYAEGHIPGAINLAARRETKPDGSFIAWRLPTVRLDGTFKPASELKALVESLGITADKEIITYCLRGGLSTHIRFTLTQLLGYPNIREYDRSWAEWGNRSDLPIER